VCAERRCVAGGRPSSLLIRRPRRLLRPGHRPPLRWCGVRCPARTRTATAHAPARRSAGRTARWSVAGRRPPPGRGGRHLRAPGASGTPARQGPSLCSPWLVADLLLAARQPPRGEHDLGVLGEEIQDAAAGGGGPGVVEGLEVLEGDRLALLVGHCPGRDGHEELLCDAAGNEVRTPPAPVRGAPGSVRGRPPGRPGARRR
jgi:hypothetical protein